MSYHGHQAFPFIAKKTFRPSTSPSMESPQASHGVAKTLLSKLKVIAAFHHVPVRPHDCELLGSIFYRYNPINNSNCKVYDYDRVLVHSFIVPPNSSVTLLTAAKFIIKIL